MKNLVKVSLILILLGFTIMSLQSQVQVTVPAGTLITPSVTDGVNPGTGGNLGRSAGITFTYTNPDWPVFRDTCLYYGISTTLNSIINAFNTSPPNGSCGGMTGVNYNPSLSNPAGGVLIYDGATNYHYLFSSGSGFTTNTLPVKLIIQASVAFYQYGNYFLIPVKGNFSYNVKLIAFSPADGMYSAGSANTWTPAVELFDNLHTDLNTSICTSWDNGSFYTLNVSSSANLSQILCNGLSTGSIDVNPSGGFGSYSYSWSNGESSEDLINIPAGVYTDTITDAQGCRVFASYEITQPAKLDVELAKTDVLCFNESNGTVNSMATGGTAPYIYAWNTGDSTANLSNLKAASYSLHLSDTNNCALDTAILVGQPDSISLLSLISDAFCFGSKDGSINISPSGGTAPYTFAWSNDSISEDISGLAAGKYSLQLKDQNNCQVSDTFTVNQPDSMKIESLVQNPSCFGDQNGSIKLTVTGGNQPYAYSWTVYSSTNELTDIGAGTYSVTVFDQHICYIRDTFIISEPAALEHNFEVKNVSCFGMSDGTINLTVNGGSAPYTYLWSNDSTSEDLASLPANDFSVTVTDQNGCNFTDNTTVTEPDQLSMFLDKFDVLCFNGTSGKINSSVFGGTEPYTFSWNTGESTKDLANLKAADYSLLVTDFNNCSDSSSVTVYQPDSISLLSQVADASCFGLSDGGITIYPSGGVPPYSYDWSNSSSSQDLVDLPSGNYTLNFKDYNNCLVQSNYVVNEPDALSNNFEVTNVTCFNGSNGSIKLNVGGGTAPYYINWNNGDQTQDISGLTANIYSVEIMDSHNCSLNDSAVVSQPGPVTAAFNHSSSEAVATFVNTSSDASYAWDFGDGFSSTDANPVHTFGHTGVFLVCLKAYNNCDTVSACDSVSITISTRIPNSIDNNSVTVYPNPSSGMVTIERTNVNALSSWKILDQTGRVILTGEMQAGVSKTDLDLSALSNGIYYLKMDHQSANPILQKIIKL